MPCYSPLTGYKSLKINSSGKRSIVFKPSEGFRDLPVQIPCGQCIGCRLERSRQWAVRCTHEASLYEKNCFITLTYDNEHLPKDKSLNVKHFQDFMKRLRKKYGNNIRFFHCGEYGETYARPHYHACIFNHDFRDKIHFKTENNNKLYISQSLNELWPFGFCLIGEVTFESAAYVARYITKKVTGQKAFDHYNDYSKETGEIFNERRPEYTTMSRRPGIGKPWLEKYMSDIYPDDFVVLNNKKLKPPKYYNNQYEIKYPEDYEKIKSKRTYNGYKNRKNNTPERLQVREFIQKEKFKLLTRKLENES